MRFWIFAAALASAIVAISSIAAAATLEISPGTLNEINVTSDSSPGWVPTPEQQRRALAFVQAYLAAIESGRYAEAYALQHEVNKRAQTLEQFSQAAQNFTARAGSNKFWRVLKITWTKDPAKAPFPGIYAAVDLAGQFVNVDRDCGYMILYQPSPSSDFLLMRRENNYMDNATARQIEAQRSRAELQRLWAELSRHCPNYTASP